MSFGDGCNIDYLAVANEIPEPQESQLNEVGCSPEGMHMTVHDSLAKEFQILDPPEFTGSSDIAVAEEWFSDIEKKLGLMSATDKQRITLATAMLKGEASHWWDINKYTVVSEGMTWREFVDSFLEIYYPFSDRNMKKIELMRLVRKEFWDRVENKIEKRKAGKSVQNPQQKKQRKWPLANLYSEPIVTTEGKICFACKESGHLVKNCPSKMQDPKTKFSISGSTPNPSCSSTVNPNPSPNPSSTFNPNPNRSPTLNSNSSHSHSPTPNTNPEQKSQKRLERLLKWKQQQQQQQLQGPRRVRATNDQKLQLQRERQQRRQLRRQQKCQQPEVAHVEVNMEDFWESEKKRKMGKTNLSPSWQNHQQQHPQPYIVPQPYAVPQPALAGSGDLFPVSANWSLQERLSIESRGSDILFPV
ncbi:PH domain-containing protein DDB_G0275795-like [Papaver somniferum]|uniref:PH domain-containing protein DDB_G0275795-like n=1 Tax=Papaver somniferum TaxID=3469 RepID=UPI000E6FD13F|nr:PH domain-containing protein DDB_G0275795-like [Papaver somniferum]XP_026380878.1 PH domain-containing protein DDB_G0275795-like [Papaver somniferum]XP_026380879.1 PH domain-containing protein DDB_G0275795-like [Papaver somniferum]XP_026380880.1 PH domain-containing protein DDB_G0275795-like [Papaver somniferum]